MDASKGGAARWWAGVVLGLACAAGPVRAASGEPSEHGYFDELPVVLTVSRLAQPLNEVPGAVTIIDRDTIRRSGARDVADVLRLVPGYMVGGSNGSNPSAAYHAPVDDYGVRNLVMVDGRSVYSSYYLGGTFNGMLGVLLEDIERIEVLRGSNSAAYGANAMFGVINIVTRHTADTRGGQVAVTLGNAGVRDAQARIGWGNPQAGFRLSVGQRYDHGFSSAGDDLGLRQWHLRSDLQPDVDNEVLLQVGGVMRDAGLGVGVAGDPVRTVRTETGYLNGQWRRQLSATEEIKVSANYTSENYHDAAPYIAPRVPSGIVLDYSGQARRLDWELQHQRGLGEGLRAVWGVGFKQADAQSLPVFGTDSPVSVREERLFGNLEWRLAPAWLLNAGAFVGHHNWTGTYVSPRLMANVEVAPDHTVRAGVTQSARPPGAFELASNMRYSFNGQLVGRTFVSSGGLQPESLWTQEVGYLGRWRDWQLSLDVRAYRERLKGLIATQSFPTALRLPLTGSQITDFINKDSFTSSGVEYQLRWTPWEGTELWFNQNLMSLAWDNPALYKHQPPRLASTLAWFQRLPQRWNLSVMLYTMSGMTWFKEDDAFAATRRLDVRLAYPFRLGGSKAEAALTVQALNGDQPTRRAGAMMQPRAYGTLRVEF